MYNVDKVLQQKEREINLMLGGTAMTLIVVVHEGTVSSITNQTPTMAASLGAAFVSRCCQQLAINEANQSRIITPEN